MARAKKKSNRKRIEYLEKRRSEMDMANQKYFTFFLLSILGILAVVVFFLNATVLGRLQVDALVLLAVCLVVGGACTALSVAFWKRYRISKAKARRFSSEINRNKRTKSR